MAHTKPSLLHKCSENNEAGIYISHTFLLQGPPLNIGEVNTHHSIQHHCIAAHSKGTCFETFERTELMSNSQPQARNTKYTKESTQKH